MVSITYWESVPYKKSQDGDYGDLSNPIRHFFAFFFLLIGKSYILIISSYRKSRDGDWDCPMGILGILKSHSAFFYLLIGKYYILGIKAL